MTSHSQQTIHTRVRFDPSSKTTDTSTTRRRRRRYIYAYYVKPSHVYDIEEKAGTLSFNDVGRNWDEFEHRFSQRTGMAVDKAFCDYGGTGFHLVLAKSTFKRRPRGDDEASRHFQERVKIAKDMLMTDKEPKCYRAPW